MDKIKTYKLFRTKNNKLYPLYVEADREMKVGEWLEAGILRMNRILLLMKIIS